MSAKTVNLINPPALALYEPSAYPHLGLLYLGAALQKEGYKCRYVDLTDKRHYVVPDADYHLITVLYPSYHSAMEVRESIVRGKVVMGGAQITIDPEAAFRDFHPDAVVVGEGDRVIVDVLNRLEGGETRIQVYGGAIEDLDSLPYPARDLLSLDVLRNCRNVLIRNYGGDGAATSVISSRGCPNRCNFCGRIVQNDRFRARSAKNVVDEILMIQEKYKINHIRFLDESFTIDKQRVFDICEMLEGKGIYWLTFARTDRITEEMAQAMYNAGCREIQIGIESGSQRLLNLMNKKTTVEINKSAVRAIEKTGITSKVLLMENYPTETPEDVEMTKQFVIDTQPSLWALTTFTPLPGSKDYETYKDDIRYKHDSDKPFSFFADDNSPLKLWLKSGAWRKK